MITLEEGEQVVMEFKKHWWFMFTWAFALVVLAILPAVILGAILIFTSFDFSERVAYLVAFGYGIWLSILWILFFIEWTDYYLDVWILTNTRIIDVEQKGLFSKDEAIIRLEDVRDMKIEYGGIIQTMLKFGSLSVQSSGARTEFYIANVPNPEKLRDLIYNYMDLAKKQKYD